MSPAAAGVVATVAAPRPTAELCASSSSRMPLPSTRWEAGRPPFGSSELAVTLAISIRKKPAGGSMCVRASVEARGSAAGTPAAIPDPTPSMDEEAQS